MGVVEDRSAVDEGHEADAFGDLDAHLRADLDQRAPADRIVVVVQGAAGLERIAAHPTAAAGLDALGRRYVIRARHDPASESRARGAAEAALAPQLVIGPSASGG